MIPFMKMHGLGNDFVLLDARSGRAADGVSVTPALARAMGDRHLGVGFDQLAVLTDADDADARLVFWNADGTTAGACGNATRCAARHLWRDGGERPLLLRTERGALACRPERGGVSVNMGPPVLDWRAVPLAKEVDLDRLPIEGAPMATGMGNPHCTFFVEDAGAADLADYAEFEHHPLFPDRTNVQVASVLGPDRLRVRVHERGVGPTLASGSSACAVACAAHRRGLTGRRVALEMDGGALEVDWREDGLWMTGPTAHVFDGIWHG
ncbi:MAG: diaminopimelate epimerase [Hasllibacter sp.]